MSAPSSDDISRRMIAFSLILSLVSVVSSVIGLTCLAVIGLLCGG